LFFESHAECQPKWCEKNLDRGCPQLLASSGHDFMPPIWIITAVPKMSPLLGREIQKIIGMCVWEKISSPRI
jgi:hypothetical protein